MAIAYVSGSGSSRPSQPVVSFNFSCGPSDVLVLLLQFTASVVLSATSSVIKARVQGKKLLKTPTQSMSISPRFLCIETILSY